jgi:hypothetical protein
MENIKRDMQHTHTHRKSKNQSVAIVSMDQASSLEEKKE